jgi:hypothetical protein
MPLLRASAARLPTEERQRSSASMHHTFHLVKEQVKQKNKKNKKTKKQKNKKTKKQKNSYLQRSIYPHDSYIEKTDRAASHPHHQGVGMVEPGGFEPPTPGLQSRCSPG